MRGNPSGDVPKSTYSMFFLEANVGSQTLNGATSCQWGVNRESIKTLGRPSDRWPKASLKWGRYRILIPRSQVGSMSHKLDLWDFQGGSESLAAPDHLPYARGRKTDDRWLVGEPRVAPTAKEICRNHQLLYLGW